MVEQERTHGLSNMSSQNTTAGNTLADMKVDAALYYLAFALYCINEAIGRTVFDQILFVNVSTIGRILPMCSAVCLAVKLLMQRYTPRQAAAAGAIMITVLLSWQISGASLMIWLVLFILAGQDVEIRPLAFIALTVYSAMFVVTIMFSMAGELENVLYIRKSLSNARSSLGFNHPNSLGKVLLEINIAYLVLRYKRIRLWDLVIPATSIYLMVQLNSVLSNRLYYANYYYEGWRPSLFGTDYSGTPLYFRENQDPIHFVVDNTYCHVLLQYGYVLFVLFTAGVLSVFLRAQKERSFNAAVYGLFVFSLLAFSETWAIRFDANYFLVTLSALMYSRPLKGLDV